ncbi:MAG: hypothetical protein ACRCU6_04005 [Fusobacteriaceae bacterium]
MIAETKVGFLKFYQYSFCENTPKDSKKLFHTYRNFYEKQKIKNHIEVIEHNIRFDLENLTREIFLEMVDKEVMHDLKKAQEKGVEIQEVSKEEFVEKYNKFAKSKKIDMISVKMLDSLIGKNSGHIRKASCGDFDLAYTFDIYSENKVIGLFGFANRFENNGVSKNLVSAGYKYLVFENTLYFKDKKIKYMDWGWVDLEDKNPEKVRFSKAKIEFGGEIVEVYEYQSYGYFIAYKLKKLIENITEGKIQSLWSKIRKTEE